MSSLRHCLLTAFAKLNVNTAYILLFKICLHHTIFR